MKGTLSEPLSLSSLMVPSSFPGTATHTRGSPPISSCRSLTLVLTCGRHAMYEPPSLSAGKSYSFAKARSK